MSAAHTSLLVFLLAALAAASGPRVSHGQTPDSVYSIGEITVTASRWPVEAARTAQRVTVLDRRDVESTAAHSVADLLAARSGLFIRRQGQGLATVSHRGGSPSQTQLLIDGMRLTDPQLGQFDLSLLPVHLFESVEVLHGPGSALYGTDGMSGVIHLRGRSGETRRLSVLTEMEAYGGRLASAGISFGDAQLSGLVSGEYLRADGDFPYRDGTLFPPRDVRRRNADRERHSFFGTIDGRAGAHRLHAAVLYVSSRQGIPALAGTAPQDERRWDEHARIWMSDTVPVGSGSLSLRGFAHRGMLRYRNPALELDETGRTSTAGLEAEYRARIDAFGELNVGGTAGYGSADHPSLSASASELHYAVFAGGVGSYGPARIYPAIRFDAYRRTSRGHTAVSPRLGLNVRAARGVPLFVKASVGTGFRVPTFNDRYWQPGGNPELEPERARSFDAGLHLAGHIVQMELTGFAARYSNQIVWTDEAGNYWSPRNLSKAVTQGFEATVRLRPVDAAAAGAIYTLTRAVDRSDPSAPSYGRQLRYVPRHLLKAYVSARVGPARMDLGGQLLGRRYVTSDESESLDPAVVADAQIGVERRLGSFRARLSVIVENLLDTRYAVVRGHPMPPRHARIRLLVETL